MWNRSQTSDLHSNPVSFSFFEIVLFSPSLNLVYVSHFPSSMRSISAPSVSSPFHWLETKGAKLKSHKRIKSLFFFEEKNGALDPLQGKLIPMHSFSSLHHCKFTPKVQGKGERKSRGGRIRNEKKKTRKETKTPRQNIKTGTLRKDSSLKLFGFALNSDKFCLWRIYHTSTRFSEVSSSVQNSTLEKQ